MKLRQKNDVGLAFPCGIDSSGYQDMKYVTRCVATAREHASEGESINHNY